MNDRERIYAAPSDRIAALLGSAIPAKLIGRLTAISRLTPRFHAIVASRLGDLPPLDSRQSAALALDADGVRATAFKAGAVWHATALARVIDGAARRGAAGAIGPDAYALALEGCSVAPRDSAVDLPDGNLAEAVTREGESCWTAWRIAQPPPIAVRLSLLDGIALPRAEHRRFGPAIVNWILDRA